MKTRYQLIIAAALLLCLTFQTCARAQAPGGKQPTVAQQIAAINKAANSLMAEKQFDKARDEYAKALALPNLSPADAASIRLNIARSYERQQDRVSAKAAYAELAKDTTLDSRTLFAAHSALGNLWANDYMFVKARAEYDAALALPGLSSTELANGQVSIARIYERQLKWAAARDAYNKCLSFDKLPDALRASVLCGIATSYGKEKNLPAMVAAIDAALQTNAAAWVKYTLLRDCAALSVEKKDLNQAISSWKKAISIPGLQQKNCSEAVFKALDLLAEQGRTAEAQQFILQGIPDKQLSPGDSFQTKLILIGLKAAGKTAGVQSEAAKAAASFSPEELQPEARLAAYNGAGKFFTGLRQYAMVREFMALADTLYRPEPEKVYQCRFVEKAPSRVEGWLASPLFTDPRNFETRFEEYNRKAADLLILDVQSERVAASDSGAAEKETAFAMSCDENGWYIFVKCADSQAEKVAAGLLGGGQLEMYFTPAYGECYYQWLMRLPDGKLNPVEWDSPSRRHRPMEPYCKTDVAVLDDGFGVSFFFPWEMVYDKLPKDGDSWFFGIINWTRAGGVSWGGKVHEIHKWGRVQWSGFTPERMLAVKRKLVMKGFGNYQKARNVLAAHWQDDMLGDPAFYRESLLPVITKLDEYGKNVGKEMSPAEIETLFTQAVPDWMEFNYAVSELRNAYLQKALFNTEKR